MRVKGSPTQIPQKPTCAGIRVVVADDDSCRFCRPHALLSCATTHETSGPDIVEPVAAAATAPAAFAEAVGLVVFGAKFDAETEDCFALSAEIKGEDF